MASTSPEPRSLPAKRNPLLAPEETPSHADLVSKRRLGQTNLTVKPGQVGISSATKRENLGQFDYAHLRAPLPKNLKGSEIFAPSKHQPHPEAYFLMRRSSDGFISATGMFKLAFPWAQHAEEQAERDYIKNLPSSSQDEVAGNVWISESFALELANDYQIVPWIVALLDEEEVKNPDESRKTINPPPPYKFTANDKSTLKPSTDMPRAGTPGRGRGRPRASTPSKGAPPSGKSGSPRKPRTTKASKEANAAAAKEANASLQASLDKEAEAAESESVDGEKAVNGERGTIQIENTTLVNGDGETTTTALKFELPGGSAEIPAPENAEQMIEEAKAMVEEAKKLEGESSTSNGNSAKGKRKAEELEEDSSEIDENTQQPTKKAKILQQKLTKERVRHRAVLGVGATFAMGAAIHYLFG